MEISSINNNEKMAFKGYDARPLRGGIFTRDFGGGKPFYSLMTEVANILNKENVDVFVQTSNGILKNDFQNGGAAPFWPFVQDRITFFKNNSFIAKGVFGLDPKSDEISKFFNINPINEKFHIEGGNYFFINDRFRESVLIGKDEFGIQPFKKIQEFFGKKPLCPVFQPDYHLDLSVRPLNNRTVLVNDPEMLADSVRDAIKNAKIVFEKDKSSQLETVIKNLETIYEEIKLSNTQHDSKARYKKLRQDLKSYKFNIIRVPGCVTEPLKMARPLGNGLGAKLLEDNKYTLNFMNAIVHERPDRSLVYITNKSALDERIGITPEIAEKINFSFEQMFINSLKGYVSPKDIKFVGGEDHFLPDLLYKSDGGLHCLFSEMPAMRQK